MLILIVIIQLLHSFSAISSSLDETISSAVLIFPVFGFAFGLTLCDLSLAVNIFLAYRRLKKSTDEYKNGTLRFVSNQVLKRLISLKTWTFVAALFILFALGEKIEFSSLSAITKQYNPTALGLMGLGLMFLFAYLGFKICGRFHQIIIEPFDDLIEKTFGFSLSPKVSFKNKMALLFGSFALCFALVISAAVITPKVVQLSTILLAQLAEYIKA